MAAIKKYKPGQFCWADFGAKDVAAAKKFYRAIFGWGAEDMPLGDGNSYSLLHLKGKDICGLYSMGPDERKLKVPPSWLPYISVANVDRAVKKAKAAGAKLCMGPMDVMRQGRMAILDDPTGAQFALWQAGVHQGTSLKAVPGTVCWHDLSTGDRVKAGKFYTKVFGWKLETRDFSGNPYHLFTLGGEGLCGMWPQPLPKAPPAWFTYWIVKNCGTTVAKVKRLGGRVVLGPITVLETCTFAIVKDPQGAAFGVLTPL